MPKATPNPQNDFHKWRKGMGWTIEKTSSALERSYRTIQRYERGESVPPAHIVAACSFYAVQKADPLRVNKLLYSFKREYRLRGFIG